MNSDRFPAIIADAGRQEACFFVKTIYQIVLSFHQAGSAIFPQNKNKIIWETGKECCHAKEKDAEGRKEGLSFFRLPVRPLQYKKGWTIKT